MTKQARLREIKEKIDNSMTCQDDYHWMADQLDLAWRVNAVAREKVNKAMDDMRLGMYIGPMEILNDALTELEKGMK